MTTDNAEKAGTPTGDDGDARDAATAGTPAGDDRDARAGAPGDEDWKALALSYKSELEERRKAEEASRDRLEHQPAATDDEGPDDGIDWDEVEDYARRKDPAARAALALRKQVETLANATANTIALRDIEDPEERAEVRRHFLKNQRRGIDINTARAEVREKKLDGVTKTQAQKIAELEAKVAALSKKPDTDVVSTHSREVSASVAKTRQETMTEAQFDAKVAQLIAAGQRSEAYKLQARLRNNEIAFKD